MEWAKLPVALVRGMSFATAPADVMGTWVRLLASCAGQENGGVIPCSGWTDREWLAVAGVTASEVEKAVKYGLFRRKPHGEIMVIGYDLDAEKTVRNSRRNGKSGGRPRTHVNNPVDNPGDSPGGYRSESRVEERREERSGSECGELALLPPPPATNSLLDFDVVGKRSGAWSLTQDVVDTLMAAFPDLDIMAECRKAKGWCATHASQRKTPSGMEKFLYSWMTRAQNGNGVRKIVGPRRPTAHPKSASDLLVEKAELEFQNR